MMMMMINYLGKTACDTMPTWLSLQSSRNRQIFTKRYISGSRRTTQCVHRTSQASSPYVGQPSPVVGSTTPSQHVWLSSFLRCGSDGMELAASRLSPGPCSEYRRLQIGAENSSFRSAIGTSSALEALRDALYISTITTITSVHVLLYY